MKPLNMITAQTDELKRLIAEYPNYPIVVICNGEVCADDEYRWWYAPSLSFDIGEILDCEQDVNEERIYSDRDEFREDIEYKLSDLPEYEKLTDKEFDAVVDEKLAEYDPYWKRVIEIRADV